MSLIKEYSKRYLQILLPLIALGLFLILIINFWVLSFSKGAIFSHTDFSNKYEVGLVFGASVKNNGEPSDILRDRLDVAADVYVKGGVKKLIVSGDNSEENYNEPVTMQKYLIKKGVTKEDIYLDYAGFDTYDSLYRAKYVFGADTLLLFTQDFHLKRALYIASRLGIESVGTSTNLHLYANDSYNNRREIFARIKAYLDVEINSSKPKFLGPPVDMSQPQVISGL